MRMGRNWSPERTPPDSNIGQKGLDASAPENLTEPERAVLAALKEARTRKGLGVTEATAFKLFFGRAPSRYDDSDSGQNKEGDAMNALAQKTKLNIQYVHGFYRLEE